MSLIIGTIPIDAIYVGSTEADSVYLGETLVYSGGTPPPPPIDYRSMPLTIESIDTNDIKLLSYHMSNTYSGKYSINSGAPVSFTVTSGDALTITGLSAGDKVQFTVDTDQTITNGTNNYRYFNSTGRFNVYGNVMSVIYANYTSVNAYDRTIADLFDSSKVVDASNLWMGDENTSIISNCFQAMFYGCTGLTAAPALPFTTLAQYCYQAMFKNCTSLTTAPELPATTLQMGCYNNMFQGCTSLTSAPALPSTSLASSCYQGMFNGCTSLTSAPALPSTSLASSCYRYMFQNCTSLTEAPMLPAETLLNRCYQLMFSGCSSLSAITCLATSITAVSCTNSWVSGVASAGTFTKAAGVNWSTGNNGIPTDWTVQEVSA